MLRSDQLGITSVIRGLSLMAGCYETIIHFFRASSWSLDCLRLLLLDRYFLSVPALKRLAGLNGAGPVHMDIVTKAKKSCRAYEHPPTRKAGRGRPPKKGATVKLQERFPTKGTKFHETTEELYGKQETIRYYCTNLLWDQKPYQELRFVLVEYGGVQSILASTCLNLDPVEIIRLYSYRFRVECMFRELKQQTGAFCYHFWTKAMPKLARYRKKEVPHPLEGVTDSRDQKRILDTIHAIERYVMLSCIAMGILQLVSMTFAGEESIRYQRYLRTPSKETVSEATVMYYLRKHIFRIMAEKPESAIARIIQKQQEKSGIHEELQAS